MALFGSTNVSAVTPALTSMAPANKTFFQAASPATVRRGAIYEWKVGPSGQPFGTDCEIAWTIIKQTSIGTGGVAMTLNPEDGADSAAAIVCLGNFTAEPAGAETGVIDGMAANQRAGYRWVVAPGGPGEIIIPAVSASGWGLRGKSSGYVGTALCGMLIRE